jgi:hypothetical protein
MTWKKIDDYCGSVYTELQPYSAFVAQGLTTNASSYPTELFRGSSRPFRQGATVPKFAAYGEPSGTVVWVNCGINATAVSFKIAYVSATSHVVDGRMGRWNVFHIATNQGLTVDAPAGTAGVNLVVDWAVNTNPLSGYQAFFVGFQSQVLDDLGDVKVDYVNANNVGLRPYGGGGDYVLTTGEKWEVLILDPNSAALQEVRFNSTAWQIGWMTYYGDAGAIAVVWPGDVVYPDMASNNPSDKDMNGNVYELGAVSLVSIAYEVTEARPTSLVDQLNHYDAISLTGVNSAQSTAIEQTYPEISGGVCEPYHLGRFLDTVPDAITATFAVQATMTASIEFVMSAVYVARAGTGSTSVTLYLDVLDETGASVLAAPVSQDFRMRRYSSPPRAYGDTYSFRALMGILAVPNEWGFRDAVPVSDIGKGSTISIATPPIDFNSVDDGGVYTIKITGGGLYVFGFSARLV